MTVYLNQAFNLARTLFDEHVVSHPCISVGAYSVILIFVTYRWGQKSIEKNILVDKRILNKIQFAQEIQLKSKKRLISYNGKIDLLLAAIKFLITLFVLEILGLIVNRIYGDMTKLLIKPMYSYLVVVGSAAIILFAYLMLIVFRWRKMKTEVFMK